MSSTPGARARRARWSRSIAPPFPKRCWKANCSGTKKAPSPARPPSASAVSKWPTAAPFFWMKSPRCRRSFRPNCCASRRMAASSASAPTRKSTSTPASWPRPTAIWRRKSRPAASARILFYRLNVVELNVPPLRERREDILPLASQFAGRIHPGPRASFRRRRRLPGKLLLARQRPRTAQRHGTRRLALPRRPHCARASARPHPPGLASSSSAESTDAGKLEEIEAQAVLQALRKNDFNRTATAKALGISRRALIYKLQRLRESGHNVDGPSKNDPQTTQQ